MVMMKRIVGWVVLLCCLVGAVLPVHAAAERRVALVIGNAAYKDAPLDNPVNDARDMAEMLRRTGFEVIELINGTQKEMNRAIAKFGDRLRSDSVALFYYAGHGLQVRGKNYLVPIDAQISNETSIRVESVDVDGVLDQLASSELNVVIIDACRNNPFERRFRARGGGGLAQMDAPKGSLIAYATAPGKTAADGDGRNGLFTGELLKQMQRPGLTIEQVFKNVRREVARATRDNQIPWESSSLTGDFYFMPGGRAPAAPAVASAAPAAAPVVASRPAERPVAAPVAAPVAPPAVAAAPPKAVEPVAKAGENGSERLIEVQPPVAEKTSPPPVEPPVQVAAVSRPAEPPKDQTIRTASFTVTGKVVLDPVTGFMNGEGVIAFVNGDRYEGGIVDNRKQGRGTFIWPNGQRYEGEWVNDTINGHGKFFYTNGDRYEGEFVNGEPHGKGTYTLQNGDVYVGEWARGNKHGQGRLTWTNGDYWEGEFRDDRQTDNGKLVYGAAHTPEVAAEPAKPAAKPVPAKKGK